MTKEYKNYIINVVFIMRPLGVGGRRWSRSRIINGWKKLRLVGHHHGR